MPRRRRKALRGGRRQQSRRQVGKTRSVLACPDEGERLCGEEGANKVAGRSGKPGACWRAPTKEKGFARRKAPTKPPAATDLEVAVTSFSSSFLETKYSLETSRAFAKALIFSCISIFFLPCRLSYLRFLRFPAKILNSRTYQNPETGANRSKFTF